MLRARNVTKRYVVRGAEVLALNRVSLEVAQGEFLSVVGPSGCGKSTLLLALGGLIRPSAGEIRFEGQPLYDLPPGRSAAIRLRAIGFLFQTFNLMPYLTALENVQVPLYLSGLSRAQQQERAAHLLRKVGLEDRGDHKPCELSVGQQQRVALARALANDPRLVLADEPTGNLDPRLADEIVAELADLNRQGVTVVMVTHDPRIAARTQRQLRLSQGSIVQS